MSLSHRHKRYMAALGLSLVLVAGIGIAAGSIVRFGHDWLPSTVSIILVALVGGAAVLACLPWWRALDEMQRERQLTSWYWGGSFGMVLGLLSAAVIGGARSPLAQGAFMVVVTEVASFTVFWLGWRL